MWSIPARIPGVAAKREVLEETGVVCTVDRLASVEAMPTMTCENGDLATYLNHTFTCTYVSGEARVADEESTEVRWFRHDDLPPMAASLLARIDAALADEVAARFRS